MKIERIPSTDTAVELKLIGRLEFVARKLFLATISEVRARDPKSIMLNMEKVEYIDSAGMGLLMLAYKDLKEAGISLILRHPQERVFKILELAKISELLSIQRQEMETDRLR